MFIAIHSMYFSLVYSKQKSAAPKQGAGRFEHELQTTLTGSAVSSNAIVGEEGNTKSSSNEVEPNQTAVETLFAKILSGDEKKEINQSQIPNSKKPRVSLLSPQVSEQNTTISAKIISERSSRARKQSVHTSQSPDRIGKQATNVSSFSQGKPSIRDARAPLSSMRNMSVSIAHPFGNNERSENQSFELRQNFNASKEKARKNETNLRRNVIRRETQTVNHRKKDNTRMKTTPKNETNLQKNGHSSAEISMPEKEVVDSLKMEAKAVNQSLSELTAITASIRPLTYHPKVPEKMKSRAVQKIVNGNNSQDGLSDSNAVASSHVTTTEETITQRPVLPEPHIEQLNNNTAETSLYSTPRHDLAGASKDDEPKLCRSLQSAGKKNGRLGAAEQVQWTIHRCAKRLTALEHTNLVAVKVTEDKIQLLCEDLKRSAAIIPMASWGKATKEQQARWSRENCDCYFPESSHRAFVMMDRLAISQFQL